MMDVCCAVCYFGPLDREGLGRGSVPRASCVLVAVRAVLEAPVE